MSGKDPNRAFLESMGASAKYKPQYNERKIAIHPGLDYAPKTLIGHPMPSTEERTVLYHNDGKGNSTYTAPNGKIYKKEGLAKVAEYKAVNVEDEAIKKGEVDEKKKAYESGLREGRDAGFQDGKACGYSDGYDDGHEDGHEDGITERPRAK